MFFIQTLTGQDHINMTLLSNVSFPDECSDIWGYVDDQGIEYAVIASFENLHIYSLEDPSAPQEAANIPVAGSSWHDMKSFQNYVYHVSESMADGITIIDMADPNNITTTEFSPNFDTGLNLRAIHNIFIDEFGILYVCGSNVEGGTLFYDLNTDPKNPNLVGTQHSNYTHDIYVRNNIMYSSQIFLGLLEIFDVNNKSNPIKIGSLESSNSFTHNSWLSDDGNFVFTTDERANSFVDAYDISDLSDIQRVDRINSETSNNGVIPHNTHYRDGYLISSWYTDGVVVTDATRPDLLVNVGRYDTFISSNAGFDGCWGVYPFFPSGIIIASDISEGLFVIQPEYHHASYLEGTVYNGITGLPLNNVSITIENTEKKELTNAGGAYKTGIAATGSYIVTASKDGYISQSKKVIFSPGQTHFLDFELFDTEIGNQDNDGDGYNILADCDDSNPNIFPGNTEIIYNGIDDDCDPLTLDDDLDQDGFASANDCDDNNPLINSGTIEIAYNGIDDDCNPSTLDDDLDQDGFASANDCDDNNAGIFPGQAEIAYNGIDDDCNPATLDDDLDQDGFLNANDCNDNDPTINPAAAEIQNNNVDENCDGVILIIDNDGDGFNSDEDCDDNNENINPNASEIVNNNIDENCDGEVIIIDADGDGFNSSDDCDESNPNVNPAATEIPNNDIDEDCDGIILIFDADGDGYNTDEDCNDTDPNINPGASEIINNDIDEDCDGIALMDDNDNDGFNSDTDCDDFNPDVNPAATEIANNDIDEDCDGIILIIDQDDDGFNSDEDCNDADPNINPSATEVANNQIDEDCDGIALIIDNDNDGFNSDEDCDDNNENINPLAEEIANNGIDEDCDGVDLTSATTEVTNLNFSVYPNPTSNLLFVELDQSGDYMIECFNANAQSVSKTTIKSSSWLDLTELTPGLYLIRITDQKKQLSNSKLIVKL